MGGPCHIQQVLCLILDVAVSDTSSAYQNNPNSHLILFYLLNVTTSLVDIQGDIRQISPNNRKSAEGNGGKAVEFTKLTAEF